MGYLAAALGSWALVLLGKNSRLVRNLYFVHDAALGLVSLSFIVLLAALYVPGKIQTWILYNNVLSRGVVIENILRANSSNDERDDELLVRKCAPSSWTAALAQFLDHEGEVIASRDPEVKDVAMTKKEKIVDALLDDYVPSNGGYVAGSAPSSGLFAIASTMSYRKRERSESECMRKRALKRGRKTEEMLELVVTRIQVRLDLFDDAEAQSLASHTVLALGDIELLDHISTSQIRKIVCYWKSEVAHPR
ncbi:hypothetical protein PsorP6_003545 [Peronosclerospora sorghi]|uniref:Uncharacterized protein n=1 Tax=Peronosclerospora sorghi TaxID=230839 RepID=A0ACC0VNX7_9STRA|nr:hypothetical protein PsorP6_003545 [Peronosclerospora sorghi]